MVEHAPPTTPEEEPLRFREGVGAFPSAAIPENETEQQRKMREGINPLATTSAERVKELCLSWRPGRKREINRYEYFATKLDKLFPTTEKGLQALRENLLLQDERHQLLKYAYGILANSSASKHEIAFALIIITAKNLHLLFTQGSLELTSEEEEEIDTLRESDNQEIQMYAVIAHATVLILKPFSQDLTDAMQNTIVQLREFYDKDKTLHLREGAHFRKKLEALIEKLAAKLQAGGQEIPPEAEGPDAKAIREKLEERKAKLEERVKQLSPEKEKFYSGFIDWWRNLAVPIRLLIGLWIAGISVALPIGISIYIYAFIKPLLLAVAISGARRSVFDREGLGLILPKLDKGELSEEKLDAAEKRVEEIARKANRRATLVAGLGGAALLAVIFADVAFDVGPPSDTGDVGDLGGGTTGDSITEITEPASFEPSLEEQVMNGDAPLSDLPVDRIGELYQAGLVTVDDLYNLPYDTLRDLIELGYVTPHDLPIEFIDQILGTDVSGIDAIPIETSAPIEPYSATEAPEPYYPEPLDTASPFDTSSLVDKAVTSFETLGADAFTGDDATAWAGVAERASTAIFADPQGIVNGLSEEGASRAMRIFEWIGSEGASDNLSFAQHAANIIQAKLQNGESLLSSVDL